MHKLVAILFLLFPIPALADKQIVEDALNCAGIYWILGGLVEIPEFCQEMYGLSITMKALYNNHANNPVDQFGDTHFAAAIKCIGENYDKEPERITSEFLRCLNWRESIGLYMRETGAMEGEITKEKMDNFLANTPAAPKPATFSPEKLEQAQAHVDAAFTYWTEFGRPTPIITNAVNTDITCTKKQ